MNHHDLIILRKLSKGDPNKLNDLLKYFENHNSLPPAIKGTSYEEHNKQILAQNINGLSTSNTSSV